MARRESPHPEPRCAVSRVEGRTDLSKKAWLSGRIGPPFSDASRLELVARHEEAMAPGQQQQVDPGHEGDARRERAFGRARETVAEPVDHVEERVQMRDEPPGLRQLCHRVEGAGEEGE